MQQEHSNIQDDAVFVCRFGLKQVTWNHNTRSAKAIFCSRVEHKCSSNRKSERECCLWWILCIQDASQILKKTPKKQQQNQAFWQQSHKYFSQILQDWIRELEGRAQAWEEIVKALEFISDTRWRDADESVFYWDTLRHLNTALWEPL